MISPNMYLRAPEKQYCLFKESIIYSAFNETNKMEMIGRIVLPKNYMY